VADKSIREQSPYVQEMAKEWEMIGALLGGTPAMRAAGNVYLPQWPNESGDSYQCRVNTAVLHPVFRRTVLLNAARPFSRPVTLGESTPANVQEWTANMDLQGSSIGAFGVQLMVECLSYGLTGVLVDFPEADGIRTQEQERTAGVRPYCVRYSAKSILGWRIGKTANGMQLSQLRLLECVEEPDGDYGTASVEQVRVLTPGRWQLYRENPKVKDQWDLFKEGTSSISEIPFEFFYGTRCGYGIGKPPLLDLAYQNVEHYQSSSDQQTLLHVARVPILFGKMLGETEVVIGANQAVTAEDKDADLSYVEHTGGAIGAGRQSILDLEDRMRATGADLISKITNVTATQVNSEGESSKSNLQQIVEVFEESMTRVLNFMSEWVKGDETAEVELYKDFSAMTTSDPQALSSARRSGAISSQTHFEELQRRDIVSSDRTWDDEKKRLQAERTTNPGPEDGGAGAI